MDVRLSAGDVIFVRGTSPFAPFIRYYDRGEFTHVAIAVSPTKIIEVQRFSSVRITKLAYEDYDVVKLDLTDEEQAVLLRKAIEMLGRKYDYVQVLSYVFRKYLGTGVWNNPKDLICSELVAYLLTQIGRLDESEKLRDITPNGLYKELKEVDDGGRKPKR